MSSSKLSPRQLEALKGIDPNRVLAELKRRQWSKDYLRFVMDMNPRYVPEDFHVYIASRLQLFAEGKIKRLGVLMPPQHGKSELSTRHFPPHLVGLNPNLNILLTAYGKDLVTQFNRYIQNVMLSKPYRAVYGNLLATGRRMDSAEEKNTKTLSIVGHKGVIRTIPRGGGITGNPVDVLIIDDLIKGSDEARSDAVLSGNWEWWNEVAKARLHNDSQVLLVNTRWAENDLPGMLMKKEKNWEWIIFPAVKTEDIREYDKREVGEPLYPKKHSLEKLKETESNSKTSFQAVYQQNPGRNEQTAIYPKWPTVPRLMDMYQVEIYGLDFGWNTDNPMALVQSRFWGNRAHHKEHIYDPELTTPQLAERMRAIGITSELIVADSARPDKIKELRDDYGFNIVGVPKFQGSIETGISDVNDLDNYYTEESLHIGYELDKYVYVTQGEYVTKTPVDKHNHLLDAIRYTCMYRKRVLQGGATQA
ncbi:terminase large subunit [Siphonobacter sp. BAB-5405]|uniref:terminase large subunit n=1 Tax=Siphonobacter sp. BAB-5405 TaxID=1864825 RepID=UPI0011AFC2FA|nr:terminase large subunit [Siphonobacter sp. BAB-5405]